MYLYTIIKTNTMNFTKTFDSEMDANKYSASTSNNSFELYRERVYTSRGSACTGYWLVQVNGLIVDSAKTLREAKHIAAMNEMMSSL
jgi:hypothetical protein